MKKVVLFALLLISVWAKTQEMGKSTESFQIMGKVQNPMTLNFSDLQQYPIHKIGNVKITNHIGEPQGEYKKLKGVLLKDILAKAEIQAESPKILSEYYIVCEASDGYKNVYSWNELFNTNVGNSVFIIREESGISLMGNEKNIMMVSPKDFRTGRRNLKGLSKIEIKRIE